MSSQIIPSDRAEISSVETNKPRITLDESVILQTNEDQPPFPLHLDNEDKEINISAWESELFKSNPEYYSRIFFKIWPTLLTAQLLSEIKRPDEPHNEFIFRSRNMNVGETEHEYWQRCHIHEDEIPEIYRNHIYGESLIESWKRSQENIRLICASEIFKQNRSYFGAILYNMEPYSPCVLNISFIQRPEENREQFHLRLLNSTAPIYDEEVIKWMQSGHYFIMNDFAETEEYLIRYIQ